MTAARQRVERALRRAYRSLRPLPDPVVQARERGALLGELVTIGRGSTIGARASIGRGTSFGPAAKLDGAGATTIGPWCAIGEQFVAISSNHDPRFPNLHVPLQRRLGLSEHWVKDDVTIGGACWIGDRVTVVAGATIGDGAVIGAGAVVTGAIPPFSIAAGVPARVLRSRFAPEIAEALLEVRWWDWPLDRILRNTAFFELDLTRATPAQVTGSIVP